MIKKTREADLHQENPKCLRNLISLDLIKLKLHDLTRGHQLQNLPLPKGQPLGLGHAQGQGPVHRPGQDQGLDPDQSEDIDDLTVDLDLGVEAVDIILAPDQGVLIHKAGVDTPGVGEMVIMTDEEDTTEHIANLQCLTDIDLAGAVEAGSEIRIIQNLQDVLVCLA